MLQVKGIIGTNNNSSNKSNAVSLSGASSSAPF